MTRFTKEMKRRFPAAFARNSETGETGVYCVESEALIVFYSPTLTTVLKFLRNGKQRDVTDDFPEISAPYLIMLCNGDIDKAKEILNSNHF